MGNDKTHPDFVIRDRARTLGDDMDFITAHRHNPFFRNGKADADAYIEFVTAYNEFINHQPKPFKRIIDRLIKL